MEKESGQPPSAVAKVVDRKAELLERRAQREAELQRQEEASELAVLELEDRLSSSTCMRGRQFEIIELEDLGEPPIAVRCDVAGIQALHKAFVNSKMNASDLDSFIVPCLASNTPEEFRAIVARRPAVGVRCANALITLLGVKRADCTKKA